LTIEELMIGVDDTDSLEGGCTTFVGYNVIKRLDEDFEVQASDYPYLVRLNPNYPPKTKGNGAVRISLELNGVERGDVVETVIDTVRRHSRSEGGTEPAIALASGDVDMEPLLDFYRSALVEVVQTQSAVNLAEKLGVKLVFLRDSNKGAVGALAALGADLSGDHTYELLAYREEGMWGKPRRVDEKSVIAMDQETRPLTFNSYDYAKRRVLVTPHGPDPVLVGIRGERPDVLLQALSVLRFQEPVAGYAIFKTNQGTDAHFRATKETQGRRMTAYSVACPTGVVAKNPEVLRGGHVLFSVKDRVGETRVICFAESGQLTKVVRELEIGDEVLVCGGTRWRGRSICMNLEKLTITSLVAKRTVRPPVCPDCGRRCKSKGLRQGYVCPGCGRFVREPEVIEVRRDIEPGTYLPDSGAMRHLAKPLCRYGIEKTNDQAFGLIGDWMK